LAEKYKNICVVGDTDQNIYSWRGAEIKNMLHFERTYPDVQTFFLEQNYRSTKNILAVANEIIEKNNFRIPKKLFTENNIGEKLGIFEGRNEIPRGCLWQISKPEFQLKAYGQSYDCFQL
jgi:DNA helicase-2/ATP-dependent DNA helicase PcrA